MNIIDCSTMGDRVVGSILDRQADALPLDAWLLDERGSYTFAEANEASNAVANALVRRGVSRGDVVAAVQRASARAVVIAVGVMKAGAIFAPINPECQRRELEEILRESVPKALIVEKEFEPLIERMPYMGDTTVFVDSGATGGEGPACLGRLSARMLFEASSERPSSDVSAEDACIILRTSGTTGRSKWVMHSHSSLLYMSWRGALGTTREGDVSYSCTAYNHMAFWTFAAMGTLVSGTAAAIDDRFTVSRYWDRVRMFDASRLLLLGAMHTFVWNLPPDSADRSNRAWLAYFTPVRAEMVPRFKERYGFETMMIGYGCSEVGRVSEGVDMDWPGADTALGEVIEAYEVEVLDDEGNPAAPGISGEICVRPKEPGVIFMGYYGNPEATKAAFRDGWYLTGDMGFRDAEGRLFFAGRKKDCVRHKGRNISLFEVEEVAERCPLVAEAAAFGVPSDDAVSEDVVALAVVFSEGAPADPAVVADFVFENAPYYFVPEYIIACESLPHNRSGRVVKGELLDAFDAGGAWAKPAGRYSRKR